jgi:hypothetical protein
MISKYGSTKYVLRPPRVALKIEQRITMRPHTEKAETLNIRSDTFAPYVSFPPPPVRVNAVTICFAYLHLAVFVTFIPLAKCLIMTTLSLYRGIATGTKPKNSPSERPDKNIQCRYDRYQ